MKKYIVGQSKIINGSPASRTPRRCREKKRYIVGNPIISNGPPASRDAASLPSLPQESGMGVGYMQKYTVSDFNIKSRAVASLSRTPRMVIYRNIVSQCNDVYVADSANGYM